MKRFWQSCFFLSFSVKPVFSATLEKPSRCQVLGKVLDASATTESSRVPLQLQRHDDRWEKDGYEFLFEMQSLKYAIKAKFLDPKTYKKTMVAENNRLPPFAHAEQVYSNYGPTYLGYEIPGELSKNAQVLVIGSAKEMAKRRHWRGNFEADRLKLSERYQNRTTYLYAFQRPSADDLTKKELVGGIGVSWSRKNAQGIFEELPLNEMGWDLSAHQNTASNVRMEFRALASFSRGLDWAAAREVLARDSSALMKYLLKDENESAWDEEVVFTYGDRVSDKLYSSLGFRVATEYPVVEKYGTEWRVLAATPRTLLESSGPFPEFIYYAPYKNYPTRLANGKIYPVDWSNGVWLSPSGQVLSSVINEASEHPTPVGKVHLPAATRVAFFDHGQIRFWKEAPDRLARYMEFYSNGKVMHWKNIESKNIDSLGHLEQDAIANSAEVYLDPESKLMAASKLIKDYHLADGITVYKDQGFVRYRNDAIDPIGQWRVLVFSAPKETGTHHFESIYPAIEDSNRNLLRYSENKDSDDWSIAPEQEADAPLREYLVIQKADGSLEKISGPRVHRYNMHFHPILQLEKVLVRLSEASNPLKKPVE